MPRDAKCCDFCSSCFILTNLFFQEVVWFELKKGEVQACDCGCYFKLVEHDPLDRNVKPKYAVPGFGSGYGSIYY